MSSPDLPERLDELIDGYRSTALLYVTAKLGIADLLSIGPASAEQLSARLQLNTDACERFLRALASVGIVQRDNDGKFSITSLGSRLCSGATGSAKARALLAGAEFLPAWGALPEAVQTGEGQFRQIFGSSAWEHRQANPELREAFQSWLHEQTVSVATSILRAYDFGKAREIADVGGGYGGLLSIFLSAHPHLRGVLIDLPDVAAAARASLEKTGLADRCRIHGADFFKGVPAGSDIYLLKSILHDWNDKDCQRILPCCRQAMGSSNRLLIIERVLGNDCGIDRATALLDLHMLVMFGGRERSSDEYAKLAGAADLAIKRVIPTDSGFQIIEAVAMGVRG